MSNKIEIYGYCEERFEPVKRVLKESLESGTDIGASFAATIEGEFVIDIWGGYADAAKTRPWEKDTIVNVFSTTKIMSVICVLMLIDREQIDLDVPVANYWPEFAQAGKENLPVRYLLSHTAGLPGFDKVIQMETLYNWNQIVNMLAAQKPSWEPGTRSGYHGITQGYLLGELVRRVTGKTIGTFFRDEVAIPLNADFHIGLPEEYDSRVAELIAPPPLESNLTRRNDAESSAAKGFFGPIIDTNKCLSREWRSAEIPAANGHGNARSAAKIGAALACGGELDGVSLLSINTIKKAIEEQSYSKDLVIQIPIRWGLGFGLNSKEIRLGRNPHAFCWGGWGGSSLVMDLDEKISYAFVMNKMSNTILGDARSANLGRAFLKSK
ncbi:MAG: serine hydrolase domain-containing protein [Promethearchaeota archaeon]